MQAESSAAKTRPIASNETAAEHALSRDSFGISVVVIFI